MDWQEEVTEEPTEEPLEKPTEKVEAPSEKPTVKEKAEITETEGVDATDTGSEIEDGF